jgi:hypothetical protein
LRGLEVVYLRWGTTRDSARGTLADLRHRSVDLDPFEGCDWNEAEQAVQAKGSEARTMTVATKTRHRGQETLSALETIRAEALFASTLQPSESPSPDQVRRAIATTLRRLGIRGCAAALAAEFGDHPDLAAARMTWALATIHTVYPSRSTIPTPARRPLALAS